MVGEFDGIESLHIGDAAKLFSGLGFGLLHRLYDDASAVGVDVDLVPGLHLGGLQDVLGEDYLFVESTPRNLDLRDSTPLG